jgi:hypothetical protein
MCGTDTDCGCSDMPFKSEKQMKYLFAARPDIAHKWASEYGAKPKDARKAAIKRRMDKRSASKGQR